MSSGFLESRIVQVHPTRRCNLACAHCYSSSGPTIKGEISVPDLLERLSFLREEGYNVVSFSGGEPLVYRGLQEVVVEAVEMGFRVNLITNGLLLDERKLEALSPHLSMIGVSLDGKPARHDAIRGRAGTFDKLLSKIPLLQNSNVPFGFAHCITSESIADLQWLFEFSIEQGAALLQLHPLSYTGRAVTDCESIYLSEADLARVYVIHELLKVQAGGRILLQLDIASVDHILAKRSQYAILKEDEDKALDAPLANYVNPIVVDESGDFWPLAFGMASSQRILSSDRPFDRGADVLKSKKIGLSNFRQMLESGFSRLQNEGNFVDWYSHLIQTSHL